MHDVVAHFHIDVPSGTQNDPNVTPSTPAMGASLPVSGAQQWVSTTAGRVVADPYSWMQAVHWVHGAGVYEPSRKHGPRFNDTTVRLAQVLAELSPCRPSVEYLMRRLRASERTVQYHLDMLREAGLLAYVEQGSRYAVEGGGRAVRRASHYAWTAPVAFDIALGIRTVGEGPQRRVVGIAEEQRSTIASLAKRAARKVRRPRRRKALCTPMEGGSPVGQAEVSGGVTTTGGARVESKPTRKKTAKAASSRKRTILGETVTAAMMAAGDLLARAAYRAVPWVRKASHDQLRWVANDSAAKGMGEQEYISWLRSIAAQYASAGLLWQPARPHALIAHALRTEAEEAQQRAADSGRVPIRWEDSTGYRELKQQHAAAFDDEEVLFTIDCTEIEAAPAAYTDQERELARLEGQFEPTVVLEHAELYGPADAIDLYGLEIYQAACRMGSGLRLNTRGTDTAAFDSTWR